MNEKKKKDRDTERKRKFGKKREKIFYNKLYNLRLMHTISVSKEGGKKEKGME